MIIACVAVLLSQVEWIAVTVPPPGSTGVTYYRVEREPGRVTASVFQPAAGDWRLSNFTGWSPEPGLWCVANNKLDRVLLLARVTTTGAVEGITGSPAWIQSESCPRGLRLPLDTVSVTALNILFVESVGNRVPP